LNRFFGYSLATGGLLRQAFHRLRPEKLLTFSAKAKLPTAMVPNHLPPFKSSEARSPEWFQDLTRLST
jgi:hypothetical protein